MISGLKVDVYQTADARWHWQITRPDPEGGENLPWDDGDTWGSVWVMHGSGRDKTAHDANRAASQYFARIAERAMYDALSAKFVATRPTMTVTT